MRKMAYLVLMAAVAAALLISGSVFADNEAPATAPSADPAIPSDPPATLEGSPSGASPSEIPLSNLTEDAQAPDGADEASQPDEAFMPAADPPIPPQPEALESEVVSGGVETPSVDETPILVDSDGQAIDLASQASANLIASGDPYWKVKKQVYAVVFLGDACPDGTTLGDTCWQSATPITEALTQIESGLLPTDRKLYIVGGTPFTENISIDGNNPADRIKGQLTGFLGVADLLGNYPVLNGDIYLEGLKYGFTLSDITVNGSVKIKRSKGSVNIKKVQVNNPAGSGIEVGDETPGIDTRHLGNVTLNQVSANENAGNGAKIVSSGAVTVTNSEFNFNGIRGLMLDTRSGKVTIQDVSASNNASSNLYIALYQNTLSVKVAVLNNSGAGYGFYARSNNSAPAILDTVITLGNSLHGIYLDTNGSLNLNNVEASQNSRGAEIRHEQGTAQVNVSNSRFNDNAVGDGLAILSKGAILLNSVSASGNQDNGLRLDTCLLAWGECTGSGAITLTSPAKGGLMGANIFDNNGENGIDITTQGAVTLSNFSASGNIFSGARVRSELGKGSVTISSTLPYWQNSAHHNTVDGITITARGTVKISKTSAANNGGYGLDVGSNPSYVLVEEGYFDHNDSGVHIVSGNPVTLDDVDATSNTQYGIYLEVTKAQPVRVVKTNAHGNAQGIFVSTDGSATLIGVEASGNSQYGAKVENCISGTCSPTANLVMSGNNYFNNNANRGFEATVFGYFSIANISALSNGAEGLVLNNALVGLNAGVTFTNSSSHALQGNTVGLVVNSSGFISLNGVNASGNSVRGASVDNTSATSSKSLTLKDCTFEENAGDGLLATIRGDIYTYGARAIGNTGSGVHLQNVNGRMKLSSSGRGLSRFDDNGNYGLRIESAGAINLANLTSNFNANDGVRVTTDDTVVISGAHSKRTTEFSNNGGYGLTVIAKGAITLNKSIVANGNAQSGIYLDTQGAAGARKISATMTQTNENLGHGLHVLGSGAVNISSIESQGNTLTGAQIVSNSATTGAVTVSGTSLVADNGTNGLRILTPNAVTVSGVTARGNTVSGIQITSGVGSAKVSASLAYSNSGHGISIDAQERVQISNTRSLRNGTGATHGDGLHVVTNNANLSIQGSSMIGNWGNGIDAELGTGEASIASTSYVGNDAGNSGAYPNLFIH